MRTKVVRVSRPHGSEGRFLFHPPHLSHKPSWQKKQAFADNAAAAIDNNLTLKQKGQAILSWHGSCNS